MANKENNILEQVSAKDFLADFHPELKLVAQSSDKYVGDCFCEESSESGTRLNISDKVFHCFKCGKGGGILELVVELIDGVSDRKEAYRWLRDEYLVNNTNKRKKKKNNIKKKDKTKSKPQINHKLNAMLYGEVYKYGKDLLNRRNTELAREVFTYLTRERKYTIDRIRSSDFFVMPDKAEVVQYLVDKFPDYDAYIKNKIWYKDQNGKSINVGLKLQGGFLETLNLGIPYRNEKGEILGLVYRSINPKGQDVTRRFYSKDEEGKSQHNDVVMEGQRYDSTIGLSKKEVIYGINRCLEAQKVIVVEGYPDATYLGTYEDINICAVGGGALGKAHVESLARNGVKEIVLSLDNDKLKEKDKLKPEIEQYRLQRKRIFDAIRYLENMGIETYVLEPTLLGDAKDLDELYREKGVDEVKKIVEKAYCITDYLVYILEKEYEILKEGEECLQEIKTQYSAYQALLEIEKHKQKFADNFCASFEKYGFSSELLSLERCLLEEDLPFSEKQYLDLLLYNKEKDSLLYDSLIRDLEDIFWLFQESEQIQSILAGENKEEQITGTIFYELLSQKAIKLGAINLKVSLVRKALNQYTEQAKFATIDSIHKLNEKLQLLEKYHKNFITKRKRILNN